MLGPLEIALIGIAVATPIVYPRIANRIQQTPITNASPLTLARAIWRVIQRRLL